MKIETVATAATHFMLFNECEMLAFLCRKPPESPKPGSEGVAAGGTTAEPLGEFTTSMEVIVKVERRSGHTIRLRSGENELGMASDTDRNDLRRFEDLGACVRAALSFAPKGHIIFELDT